MKKFLLMLISFIFPFVGIIYYFVKKEDTNRKIYLITSIISIVLISLSQAI